MRLILYDLPHDQRYHFDPLALSRPIWDLRCGMTSLAEKMIARTKAVDVACFVPPYMAAVYAEQTDWKINDPSTLSGDDLLLVDATVRAASFDENPTGPSQVACNDQGRCLYARVAQHDLAKLNADSIEAFLGSAKEGLPAASSAPPVWNYTWDLILENPNQLTVDISATGRSGVEGSVEQLHAIRGSAKDVYIAAGAVVHPMVVIDAEHGPVYIDEGAEIQPFSRIEGPCYIGKNSILLGAKCREGNSIGPTCRIGGEVEESIIHANSNKYHDGFLGHAYVGEWVNLGALTTNSDLKNDYTNVTVVLDGKSSIDTGSRKVGSLIGDHAKTSIGVLFNTGAYVGAMSLIVGAGKLLPKFIPSFAWFIEGVVTEGSGKRKLYETAKKVMGGRGREWTEAQESMWDEVFNITAPPRDESIKKGRHKLGSQRD